MKLASIIKTRLFYTGTFTCFIQILDEAIRKLRWNTYFEMHRKYSQNISETIPTITNCAFNYAYFAYGSLYFSARWRILWQSKWIIACVYKDFCNKTLYIIGVGENGDNLHIDDKRHFN